MLPFTPASVPRIRARPTRTNSANYELLRSGWAILHTRSTATRKAEGQLSGHSSNNYSQMPTSVVSMACCSGAWTVLAGKG